MWSRLEVKPRIKERGGELNWVYISSAWLGDTSVSRRGAFARWYGYYRSKDSTQSTYDLWLFCIIGRTGLWMWTFARFTWYGIRQVNVDESVYYDVLKSYELDWAELACGHNGYVNFGVVPAIVTGWFSHMILLLGIVTPLRPHVWGVRRRVRSREYVIVVCHSWTSCTKTSVEEGAFGDNRPIL